MSDQDAPKIEIGNIMDLWCRKHWKPFHGKSPHATAASLLLIQKTLNNEQFLRTCGYNPDTGEMADVARINHELHHIKPLCCYLGDEVMKDVAIEVAMQVNKGRRMS